MQKQLLAFWMKTVLLFGGVAVCVAVFPTFNNHFHVTKKAEAMLSAPSAMAAVYDEMISNDISPQPANNNTASGQEVQPVMNPTGSKESNDGWDITATPSDVAELMKTAQSSIDESDYVGKTSEEPYLGGGTVVAYDGVEVQSKIPADFYEPDIASLLSEGADLTISDKSKPTVLVYHSHTTEAYALLDTGFYISSDARSDDNAKNVVRVGDELVKALERKGFVVLHDTEIHDEDYNGSYDSSRASVEKVLEEYPSVEITIDLHRDDITYKDKTKVKPTAEINGKKAAKMMIIAGCEYGKVKNYPDWEYNLRFDLSVQQGVNAKYPGVMRPVLFSQRKYNMYETHNSFLLEIGTDANTLEEACYSARLFGDALADLLDEKYVKK